MDTLSRIPGNGCGERFYKEVAQVSQGTIWRAYRVQFVRDSDTKGLRRLAEQASRDFQGEIVFYDGSTMLPLDRDLNLHAVPVSRLWEI